jgi:hypothetical protein
MLSVLLINHHVNLEIVLIFYYYYYLFELKMGFYPWQ